MLPLVALELLFHALGVLEKYLTLWLLLGVAAAAPDLLHRRDREPPDDGGLQVRPAPVGVSEAGPRSSRTCSASAPRRASPCHRAESAYVFWSLVGTAPARPARVDAAVKSLRISH